MHQSYEEPPKTIRQLRYEIERRMTTLLKKYREDEQALMQELRDLQKKCPHDKFEYHGDPAGGSDSFHCCDDCDYRW